MDRRAVLQLHAREDEALLVGRGALLVLDLELDVRDGVAAHYLERDGLARLPHTSCALVSLIPRACHRKQQILVISNRALEADSGLAVCSPHCQTSRLVVASAILIAAACRACGDAPGLLPG